MKFQPGKSGNPKGKPRGPHKAGRTIREMAQEFGPAAVAVLQHEMVHALDPRVRIGAAAALLDRGYGKPATETHAVPLTGDTLTKRAMAALDAVATGQVSPSEASALVGAVATLAKLVETDDLVRRLKELEAHIGKT